MNQWTFTGRVESVEEKTTAKGKTFARLTVADCDDAHPQTIECTQWRGRIPEVGDWATLEGKISGRARKTGGYWTSLDAERVTVADKRETTPPREQPPPASVTERRQPDAPADKPEQQPNLIDNQIPF